MLKEIQLESDAKVVFIRADNRKGEFGALFQEGLKELGVQFEPSPPYKHSLNGVVERAMGKLNATILSLLYQA